MDQATKDMLAQRRREAARDRHEQEVEAQKRRAIVAEWLRQNPAKSASPSVGGSELERVKAELRVMLAGTDSSAAFEWLLDFYEKENASLALKVARTEGLYEAVITASSDIHARMAAKDAALNQAARELLAAQSARA